MFDSGTFNNKYKSHLKKNNVFLKDQKGGMVIVVLITTISILSLAALTYFLLEKKFITEEFFFGGIVVFLGWLFALLTSLIHTRQNREDSLIIQKNEIKKRLEIEAYKEVNKMILKNQNALTDISVFYISTLKNKIKMEVIQSNDDRIVLMKNVLENLYLGIREQNENMIGAWADFMVSIETYEIVLIQFNKLKDALNKEFRKILFAIDEFDNYFLKIIRKKSLEKVTDLNELDQKIFGINEKLMDLACYLSDYRVELMHLALGDIFHSNIPKRKPQEPFKTLMEIAKKNI